MNKFKILGRMWQVTAANRWLCSYDSVPNEHVLLIAKKNKWENGLQPQIPGGNFLCDIYDCFVFFVFSGKCVQHSWQVIYKHNKKTSKSVVSGSEIYDVRL